MIINLCNKIKILQSYW